MRKPDKQHHAKSVVLGSRGGEMAYQLRALGALAEDLGLVPSIHVMVCTIHNSSSSTADTFLWHSRGCQECT